MEIGLVVINPFAGFILQGGACDGLACVAYMTWSTRWPVSRCVEEGADLVVVLTAFSSTAALAGTAESSAFP